MTEAVASGGIERSRIPSLEMQGIAKQFGTVVALTDVSLSVQPGSIHALLGENGAGKTTLMRIAFGMIAADKGSILRDGTVLTMRSPADAIAARIGMVHQQFSLIPAMTVAENIALGGKGIYRFRDIADQMSAVAETTGLSLDPRAKVSSLTSAERQKLEIIRTLAHDATLLILDEPTAVLTDRDTGELFEQLHVFVEAGRSVVLITHKLRNALDHADEVSVLRRGELILNAPMSSVTRESLTTAMLGTSPTDLPAPRPSVNRLHVVARVAAPAVEVFAGEILGVAALEGAAGPLLRSLAGREQTTSASTPAPQRTGFVPENRQDEAIIPDLSLTENFALRNAGQRRGLVDWKQVNADASEVIRLFDVRAAGVDVAARSLSGGNQQRFVLGRELSDNPSLLVLENPTQGLDVNAAAAVHERMRTARAAGTAIVFYSSDLDELAELSDRVIVIGGGQVISSSPDAGEIGQLLLGVETAEHPIA